VNSGVVQPVVVTPNSGSVVSMTVDNLINNVTSGGYILQSDGFVLLTFIRNHPVSPTNWDLQYWLYDRIKRLQHKGTGTTSSFLL